MPNIKLTVDRLGATVRLNFHCETINIADVIFEMIVSSDKDRAAFIVDIGKGHCYTAPSTDLLTKAIS